MSVSFMLIGAAILRFWILRRPLAKAKAAVILAPIWILLVWSESSAGIDRISGWVHASSLISFIVLTARTGKAHVDAQPGDSGGDPKTSHRSGSGFDLLRRCVLIVGPVLALAAVVTLRSLRPAGCESLGNPGDRDLCEWWVDGVRDGSIELATLERSAAVMPASAREQDIRPPKNSDPRVTAALETLRDLAAERGVERPDGGFSPDVLPAALASVRKRGIDGSLQRSDP